MKTCPQCRLPAGYSIRLFLNESQNNSNDNNEILLQVANEKIKQLTEKRDKLVADLSDSKRLFVDYRKEALQFKMNVEKEMQVMEKTLQSNQIKVWERSRIYLKVINLNTFFSSTIHNFCVKFVKICLDWTVDSKSESSAATGTKSNDVNGEIAAPGPSGQSC